MSSSEWEPLDHALADRLLWLPDASRAGTTLIVGPPGCGKSRLLGRGIVWQDLVRGLPQVVLDPAAEVYKNLFDKILRCPPRLQKRLWRRIEFVEVGGHYGCVRRNPLLYRVGDQSLYSVAQRFVDVTRKSDPALQGASILGANALAELATHVGIALFAVGEQYDHAHDLLSNLPGWAPRLEKAAAREPQARPSVEYLLGVYDKLGPREKQNLSLTFLRKLLPFRLDPAMRAQFCTAPADVDLDRVAAERRTLIVSFKHVSEAERKKFCLFWFMQQIFEYARRRPSGKDQLPFGVVIDELTYLLVGDTRQTDPLADDLMELIARLARNRQLWVTIAMQGITQASKPVQEALKYCATYILGSTPDLDWAIENAKRWRDWDPEWVKKTTVFTRPATRSSPGSTNVTTTEYTLDEQRYLHARKQMKLPTFHFYVAVPPREGSPATGLQRVSIARFDAGCFPDEALCDEAARRLAWRDGRPLAERLAEVAPDGDIQSGRVSAPGEVARPRRRFDVISADRPG